MCFGDKACQPKLPAESATDKVVNVAVSEESIATVKSTVETVLDEDKKEGASVVVEVKPAEPMETNEPSDNTVEDKPAGEAKTDAVGKDEVHTF